MRLGDRANLRFIPEPGADRYHPVHARLRRRGLGVGSLIGKGSGRDVAMVLGTIGGAYAGHKVQQRYKDPVQGQQIVVRTTTGVLVTVTQPANPNLAVGQNVYIEGSGEDARVVLR